MSATFARHLAVGGSLGLVNGAVWGGIALVVAPDVSLGWYLAFVGSVTVVSTFVLMAMGRR